MNARNAHRIQPRDSMYPLDAPPFNLPAANDEPANEPDGLIDSWPFLGCLGIAALALLWMASQGGLA